MDYDILDVWENIPQKTVYYPFTGMSCSVHVNFQKYLNDMRRGQETIEKARNQLALDIPRCNFCVDGETCSVQDMVPDPLVRFCTQSVLCLPLEMLCSDEYFLVDSKNRMFVDVWGTAVTIKKQMKVLRKNGIVLPFTIKIYANFLEPYVHISITFSSLLTLMSI